MQNYNALKLGDQTKFSKDDFLVVVVVDGYERIPESFKKFARERKFLDEDILVNKGYMTKDKEGNFKMKNMPQIMDEDVKAPDNVLHVF